MKITGQVEVGVCLSDVSRCAVWGQFLEDPEGENKELPLDRAMESPVLGYTRRDDTLKGVI